MKESGIHQLYLVANSLQCVKASGDRGTDKPTSTSDASADAPNDTLPSEPTVDTGIGRPSLVSFTKVELDLVRSIALSQGAGGPMGLLVASLCPTIFGHELVKLGLLLGNVSIYHVTHSYIFFSVTIMCIRTSAFACRMLVSVSVELVALLSSLMINNDDCSPVQCEC